MPATVVWQEDNGTATGSPAKGATRANASQVDWKSVDDIATSRNTATIIAGQNSFPKYQAFLVQVLAPVPLVVQQLAALVSLAPLAYE